MAKESKVSQMLENLAGQLLAASAGPPTAAKSTRGKGRSKKGKRKTEKEEDDELLAEGKDDLEDGEEKIARLTVQPPIITGQMRAYQLEGLNWMATLFQSGLRGGILADEMGLGKTLQSISLLAYWKHFKKIPGPHLVVVPLTTLDNWMREFKNWCPTFKVCRFHGNKDERAAMLKADCLNTANMEVCVTSYEMCNTEKSALKKVPWQFVVVDEAHRLKNENSMLSQILRLFKSKHRLLLTGTPLQNNLHELWALLNFLLPDFFAKSEDFDAMFEAATQKNAVLTQLHKILRPVMLRRLKSEVEKALLPKKETLVYVGMSAMQAKLYQNILKNDLEAINGTSTGPRLLNIVMQLRKAANHPYLFDGQEDRKLDEYGDHVITNSGKLSVLDKLLPKLQARGSRVLIFSQMTRTLDIIEDYCHIRNYQYCRIDGNTNAIDRDLHVKEYNKEKSSKFLFLLSTRAGGLGINLATADIVVLYDSDWNPQMDLQAQDRAHRIGQKKQVIVYRFVTQDTIEEKIIERANIKLRLDAMVIQQGRIATGKKLTKQDMMEMIRFGADKVFKSTDGTITDEDIDLILARGEQKTTELNNKLQDRLGDLQKFSLSGGPVGDYKDVSLLEGKSAKIDVELVNTITEAMGKRERKLAMGVAGFDVSKYFSEKLSTAHRSKVQKPKKGPKLQPFQFMPERYTELCDKEAEFFVKYQYDPNPPATKGLTDEEEAEKDDLASKGFASWNRSDYRAYLRACERFGRVDIESIKKKVASERKELTEDDVQRYHEAFWVKMKDLDDHDKIEKSIKRGEARVQKFSEKIKTLESSLSEYKGRQDILDNLKFKYSPQQKGKGYSDLVDAYLVYLTQEEGYGNWEKVIQAIRKDLEFRFDYFLRSRTAAEIQRRVDILLGILKKAGDDEKGESKKPRQPRSKKGATPAADADTDDTPAKKKSGKGTKAKTAAAAAKDKATGKRKPSGATAATSKKKGADKSKRLRSE